jgi:hypothetical protein
MIDLTKQKNLCPKKFNGTFGTGKTEKEIAVTYFIPYLY